MSVQFLINNPHIAPFLIVFFIGFVSIVLAPLHYRARIKKYIAILTPFDLTKYNRPEKKMLSLGVLLLLIGILGVAIMTEKYGYNYTYTDISGRTSKVNSKNNRY